MKDLNDKQTLDLIDKPRRGRPSTGKAKSQAQIQRDYRQRLAAEGSRPVMLTAAERSFLVECAVGAIYGENPRLAYSVMEKLMDRPSR